MDLTMKLKATLFLWFAGALSLCAQNEVRPPIMGWASWNNYHVGINEDIVKAQADAMATNGMKDVGYEYINTDDGYFGGRTKDGKLLVHPTRFPSGMKSLADYIHSKGLKAGTYTDAGYNTCGCHGDADTISVGCGLMGHEWADLTLMLRDWDYDFIKVDWCGGTRLGLDVEQRYRYIIDVARKIKPDVVFNVCRWQFPGTWVMGVADSWRVSGDITEDFDWICRIIDINADLWRYSQPGHYNDMDMLQVGRGMTYEEDKAHFSMWAIMVSPLLAGNDLTTMSKETLGILTNKDIIALNQDPLFYQARRFQDFGDLEVWAKPMMSTMSGDVAVALLNRSKVNQEITFDLEKVGLDASEGYTMKDLWSKKEYPKSTATQQTLTVPAHGVVVLRLKGTAKTY
ncbi:MAG: glycoside hydrolase family 27 protein, partial [Bacteroidaceae bacterium]|nr:glycoside hydrolase family 27 protein [Bacteroidaceae bacterium]MCF0186228.1 glycoside hydrolase family 27 protein [Bacteroidaceae bacterium]